MTAPGSARSLLVLGLGNVLCGDDGLGVAAVEMLLRRYQIPDGVRVLDGGTLGLALLSHIRESDDVILVDAVLDTSPAGTLVRLEGDDVGPAVRTRLSPHQIGVADLLNALHMLDAFPQLLVLLGLVPETLELGLDRSPSVEAQLPTLVDTIVGEARRMGHELVPNPGDRPSPPEARNPTVRALGL